MWRGILVLLLLNNMVGAILYAQDSLLWHGIQRKMRYAPNGQGFYIRNGTHRFNRALYGGNTAFRVEAGDLPQFALYLPGMGGSMQLGVIGSMGQKWLIDAQTIDAWYESGQMHYAISDVLLQGGSIHLYVLAMPASEGVLLKIETQNLPSGLSLVWAFGGATGKRFNRDGDIGADPESVFYLSPEKCKDNHYFIQENTFALRFGSGVARTESARYELAHRPDSTAGTVAVGEKILWGILPPSIRLKTGDGTALQSPLGCLESQSAQAPILVGNLPLAGSAAYYFCVQVPDTIQALPTYSELPTQFESARQAVASLANRIRVHTPDSFLNPLGSALALAADAIWEAPSFLHGAVAWRMRLNGWRGAYAADPLGWHDRARQHFDSYGLSQLTTPDQGLVVPDTALHYARQLEALGTSLFSSGYICRNPGGRFQAHHYDMNLVFIDQLIHHLQWTGDRAYARAIWPLLTRHLAWEKRNFDGDGDYLYDAYCAIWASDALEYSGGGVTHTSAYNYKANLFAAQLATLLGEDPTPFEKEAAAIHAAVNRRLWLPRSGWFAEYVDILGEQRVHPSAGLWTIYHALDASLPDAFQAYQAMRYVDLQIPHIPVEAVGAPRGLFTLSTTNWMPYTWSVNNVALAEVMHTALAYWQAGRNETACQLWKSALIESMYLGSSPGSFQQLSFYDAFRGELYRDFADPIGMVARTLVEGLFGLQPDALRGEIQVRPGWPASWAEAALETPDIDWQFERKGDVEQYHLRTRFEPALRAVFYLPAYKDQLLQVTVNGEPIPWTNVVDAVGSPQIRVVFPRSDDLVLRLVWSGGQFSSLPCDTLLLGETAIFQHSGLECREIADPQGAFQKTAIYKNGFKGLPGAAGDYTVFARVAQGQFVWWQPVDIMVREALALRVDTRALSPTVVIENPGEKEIQVRLWSGNQRNLLAEVYLEAGCGRLLVPLPARRLLPGANRISVEVGGKVLTTQTLVFWNTTTDRGQLWDRIDLTAAFNESVAHIFDIKYVTPRVPYPTVQIPTQGIGNWCYPLVKPLIDDTGLRALAAGTGFFYTPQGIPFATPAEPDVPNTVFVSQWDNFPTSDTISLSGHARHLYLLMAGTTNPMQSRIENGRVEVYYQDGSHEELSLQNPDTWYPIEQDYYRDGFAFEWQTPWYPRIHLKTARMGFAEGPYTSIKGFSDRIIEGGAAMVLDLQLNPDKPLHSLRLTASANEVVIGLLGATLLR